MSRLSCGVDVPFKKGKGAVRAFGDYGGSPSEAAALGCNPSDMTYLEQCVIYIEKLALASSSDCVGYAGPLPLSCQAMAIGQPIALVT